MHPSIVSYHCSTWPRSGLARTTLAAAYCIASITGPAPSGMRSSPAEGAQACVAHCCTHGTLLPPGPHPPHPPPPLTVDDGQQSLGLVLFLPRVVQHRRGRPTERLRERVLGGQRLLPGQEGRVHAAAHRLPLRHALRQVPVPRRGAPRRLALRLLGRPLTRLRIQLLLRGKAGRGGNEVGGDLIGKRPARLCLGDSPGSPAPSLGRTAGSWRLPGSGAAGAPRPRGAGTGPACG